MVSDREAKTARRRTPWWRVVLQVRAGELQVLLWERALEPFAGTWSLPGGELARGRDARAARSAATSRARSTCASSPTSSSSRRAASPDRSPLRWELATAYLGLVPSDLDPALPADTQLAPGRQPPAARVRPRADRARRPRAPAREALVHERRLRARARDVHDLRAPRPLPRRARPRRLVDEPPARAPPPPPARPRPARAASPAAPAAARPRSTASASAASRSPTSSRCCAARRASA